MSYSTIMNVDLACVPVVSNDRSMPRKARSAAARKLLRQLGIKGVSVTAPNYSMAHTVDVRPANYPLPEGAFLLDGVDYQHRTYSDMPGTVPAKALHLARWEACKKLETILLKAFPNHDDRSDYQTDYFDHCWSIN